MNDRIESLVVGGTAFKPGERGVAKVVVGHLITHEEVLMPVNVLRGKRPGPCVFISAGIHGDELNGVEILRRLLKMRLLHRLRGDVLVVPIVNQPAFIARSRYLPDRRDLNRLFPGSASGSFGARLARTFMEEVVQRADYGIDLHTGAQHRSNLPQIRITTGNAKARELAQVFGCPVVIESPLREGSLRESFEKQGKALLTFEGGESLRLDAPSLRFGQRGIINVLRHLGMLPAEKKSSPFSKPVFSDRTFWERAPRGGTFTPLVPLGKVVDEETVLGFISDPFGKEEVRIYPREHGVVIGRTNLGIADEGDALFHIAADLPGRAERAIQRSSDSLDESTDHPVSDEPFMED